MQQRIRKWVVVYVVPAIMILTVLLGVPLVLDRLRKEGANIKEHVGK
jgi:ABC-type dipeptide/oligopeptide/nickel transport system permease subunit